MLVDSVTPPRAHDHDDGGNGVGEERAPMVSGRTRHNKLVHLPGGVELVGRLVDVRVEHAGPYALRGVPVTA